MSKALTRQEQHKILLILKDRFPYYGSLSQAGKKKFYERLIEFIRSKKFYGKEGLDITEEMLILVGASAIQLTFGLKRYLIAHFKTIIMFPSTFHFRLLNQDLKGATSPRGTLYLSWESFQHGYENVEDKRNLGLHEMAHALKINILQGTRFDQAFASYFNDWEKIGNKEFQQIKRGQPSFLRKYGGTNRMEFFAVCVEHFFEAPEKFQEELPDVYNHLCVLLNQNPMNIRGDYELTSGFIKMANLKRRRFPLPEKIKLNFANRGWHWSYSLGIFGSIFGLPIAMGFYDHTFIGDTDVIYAIGGAALLAGIVQFKSLVVRNVWNIFIYPFYLVFGCAPLICGVLLMYNYFGGKEIHYSEEYTISSFTRIERQITYHLEHEKYSDFERLRTFEREYLGSIEPGEVKLKFTFRKGALGYPILEDRSFVYPDSAPKHL